MRTSILSLLAIATLALAACGDDATNVPADTGGTGGADTGTEDTGATGDTTGGEDATGGTCESGVECARIADCASAGLAGAVCQEGCCVDGGGGGTDAGTGGEPCGDVTFQGECDGATVRWCDDSTDTLGEVDCATFYEGVPGTCAWFGDDFGYWCGVEGAGSCLAPDGSIALCASAEDAGCVVAGPTPEDLTFTCAEPGIGTCDGETFDAAYCEGDLLVAQCTVVQPLVFDCTTFGGTCADGACVGATEGSACDGETIVCADGFDCVEGESGASTCVAGEGPAPTCDDGEQNGDEEGVDCGGSCPDACE